MIATNSNLFLRSLLTGHVANDYGTSFFSRDILAYASMSAKVFCRLFLPPNPDAYVQLIAGVALLSILVVSGGVLYRRTRDNAADRNVLLALTSLVAIACAIGIVGGVSTRTSESDRFLYLPSAFLCLFIARALQVLFDGKWRTMVTIAFGSVLLFLLLLGRSNWISASHTIERIVASVPQPPPNGRLAISWLPGDHNGAFIFRHGFNEALVMAGRDTARIVHGDTLLFELSEEGRSFSLKIGDDTLPLRPADRIVRWDDKRGFVDSW